MALGDNPISALFDPGDKRTAAVTAAVTAGRFVKISAAPEDGLIKVAPCGEGQRAIGVARWDAPTAGDVIGIYCGSQTVPMVADGAITAGDVIMSGATGGAKLWVSAANNANRELGIAETTAADGASVHVKLRDGQ